ncbi:MAG: DNA methyltransferase [Bacteroidota bacterium]
MARITGATSGKRDCCGKQLTIRIIILLFQYKHIEQSLSVIREQLSLFDVQTKKAHVPSYQLEFKDWDFASADTKIETHGFHPYPAMMIPQIARLLIQMHGKKGQPLLDPFCGSGTALVEARIAGLNSYGIDINPLALLLSKVKTTPLDIQILKKYSIRLCDDYLKTTIKLADKKDSEIIPKFFNIDYWFRPKISRQLFVLKSVIDKIPEIDYRGFFLIAFSQTVRESSYTRNGEFKLFRMPAEQMEKFMPNVPELFFSIVQKNLPMMAEFARAAKNNVFVNILDEDSRKTTAIPTKTVDLIVTSPPYGDSRTTVAYGQYSRLSLQWLGLPWEKVKNIDTISLGGRKYSEFSGFKKYPHLMDIVKKIEIQDSKRVQDVASFFYDLELCFSEFKRVCKKNAILCFVVGNRTVKGVKIPTDAIITELGNNVGMKHIKTYTRNIPNKRMPSKNSPTNIEGQLGETMTKEYIVVLKNN